MAEADVASAVESDPAKPVALTSRITGSLARRMIAIATIWISVLLIGGGFALAGQPTDRWIGVAVVLIGAFDFAVMPLLLARRWRSPKDL